MSLLTLENISKEYGSQPVLSNINLRVERGERLALVGPNGAGKTTLLRIAMGLEEADTGSVIIAKNCKVGYLSQDLNEIESSEQKDTFALHYEKVSKLEKKLRNLEKKMAEQSEQDRQNPLLSKSLLDEYTKLLLRYEAMDGYVIESKISRVLLGLGLRQDTLNTPLSSLSGGEKMRVAVARLLLEEPDLLILDEPTNHLDIRATEWLESFLKSFSGGIVFVSHDRYFLDRVATRVAELDQGNIYVQSGNYSNFVNHKKQLSQYVANEQKRLQIALKNAQDIVQGMKSKRLIKAYKSREHQIKKLNEELKTNLAAVKKEHHLKGVHAPKIEFKKVKHVSKDIALAEHVTKSFGSVTLFRESTFQIKGGEKVGIIGPNGCGKSTLIKMLLGHDQDYEGTLRLGSWVKYSYMGQEVLFENESLSMLELIMAKKDLQEDAAREHLARFQFYGDEVQKSIQVLSGGERVRLYLACVMLEEADCLILDEPTNHLDLPARDAVEAALNNFKGTIIAVTHDRYYLSHCVGKILEIDQGKITTYNGNYDVYKQVKFGNEEDVPEKKKGQITKSSGKNSSSKKSSRPLTDNSAKERQSIEAQIMLLEENIKEMETSFDKSTPPEKYQEYDNLLKEVECLYEKWNNLLS